MISLRKRKTKKGYSLYLDYNRPVNRYEYLDLYLGKDKEENKKTLELAENIRAKRQLETQAYKHGFPVASDISLIDWIRKKKKTKTYSNIIYHLETYGDISLSRITRSWGENFRDYLYNNVKSRNSVQLYVSSLKTVLNLAVESEPPIIPTNPLSKVKVERQDTEKEYLEFNELQQLALTPCKNKEVARAFLYACYTGQRLSDIKKIKVVETKQLNFRQKKTGKINYLPLSQMADKLLTPEKPVNNNAFNLPLSDVTTNEKLAEWVEAAGINKHITFHCSRHTFATLLLTYGVDIYTVSKLLGHSSIKNTEIYSRIIDRKREEAVLKIPEVTLNI
jgi:integrase